MSSLPISRSTIGRKSKNNKRADWPTSPVGTDQELDEIVRLVLGGTSTGDDPDLVSIAVKSAAVELLKHLRDIASSSMKPEQLRKLREIFGAASKLRSLLSGLDDITHELLIANVSGAKRKADGKIGPTLFQRRFMERAGKTAEAIEREYLPASTIATSIALLSWDKGLGRHPLKIIELAAKGVEEFFGKIDPNCGAPGNLLQKIASHPQTVIAMKAAGWIAAAQGIDAVKGTPDTGLVFQVAHKVWQYATGQDLTGSTLADSVKVAAQVAKKSHKEYRTSGHHGPNRDFKKLAALKAYLKEPLDGTDTETRK